MFRARSSIPTPYEQARVPPSCLQRHFGSTPLSIMTFSGWNITRASAHTFYDGNLEHILDGFEGILLVPCRTPRTSLCPGGNIGQTQNEAFPCKTKRARADNNRSRGVCSAHIISLPVKTPGLKCELWAARTEHYIPVTIPSCLWDGTNAHSQPTHL